MNRYRKRKEWQFEQSCYVSIVRCNDFGSKLIVSILLINAEGIAGKWGSRQRSGIGAWNSRGSRKQRPHYPPYRRLAFGGRVLMVLGSQTPNAYCQIALKGDADVSRVSYSSPTFEPRGNTNNEL